MITNADPAVLWPDRLMPDIDKAKAALERIADNGRHEGAAFERCSRATRVQPETDYRQLSRGRRAVIALVTAGQRVGRRSTWRTKSANYALIADMPGVPAPQRNPS